MTMILCVNKLQKGGIKMKKAIILVKKYRGYIFSEIEKQDGYTTYVCETDDKLLLIQKSKLYYEIRKLVNDRENYETSMYINNIGVFVYDPAEVENEAELYKIHSSKLKEKLKEEYRNMTINVYFASTLNDNKIKISGETLDGDVQEDVIIKTMIRKFPFVYTDDFVVSVYKILGGFFIEVVDFTENVKVIEYVDRNCKFNKLEEGARYIYIDPIFEKTYNPIIEELKCDLYASCKIVKVERPRLYTYMYYQKVDIEKVKRFGYSGDILEFVQAGKGRIVKDFYPVELIYDWYEDNKTVMIKFTIDFDIPNGYADLKYELDGTSGLKLYQLEELEEYLNENIMFSKDEIYLY